MPVLSDGDGVPETHRAAAESPPGRASPHPPRAPRPATSSGPNVTIDGTRLLLGIVAVLAVVLGASFFGYHMLTMRTMERAREEAQAKEAAEKAQIEATEKVNRARMERERAEAERVAREKKETEARRAREQERAQQAEKEAAEKRAAQKEQDEAAQKIRDLYRNAPKMFERKVFRFATSAPKGQALDPRLPSDKERRFWVVDAAYPERREFYVLTTSAKGLTSVKRLAPNAEDMTELDVADFEKRLDNERWAVTLEDDDKDEVWLFGTPESSRFVEYPDALKPFVPLDDELGDLAPVAQALRLRFDTVKYRLSLKAKTGGDVIPVGIVDCDAQISLKAIRTCMGEALSERKVAQLREQIKPPRLQKLPKRTVIFYDGNKVSRSIGGVTKIPRSFEASSYTQYNKRRDEYGYVYSWKESSAYRKWNQLAQEAQAQEQRENEIREANREAQEEYNRKLEQLKEGVPVTTREITEALDDYRLYVERGK